MTGTATRIGALLLAAVLLVGCAALGLQTRRGPVALMDAMVVGGSALDVTVSTCGGEPELARLEQTADTVTLEVVSSYPVDGVSGACADFLRVDLDAPLGDREVVDAVSGQTLPINGHQ